MKKIFSNMKPARMAIMLILALLTVQTVQADPNTTDKTALATAISEAETYSGSIQRATPTKQRCWQASSMVARRCRTMPMQRNLILISLHLP